MKRLTAFLGGSLFLIAGNFLASAIAEQDSLPQPRQPGWGIDAVLSSHVQPEKVDGYIDLLRQARIEWIRERGPGSLDSDPAIPLDTYRRQVWRKLKAANFRVVAFSGALRSIPVNQKGNQLPENLLDVYAASYELGFHTLGEVDAFEMVGEPDAKYCRDLPDRVVAIQKATYLGIKDGAADAVLKGPDSNAQSLDLENQQSSPATRRSAALKDARIPLVLSGALAFPPGNWLDLAAANGIYEFSDAVNFHHYGFASDMVASIRAHREFAAQWSGRGELPVWITEAGLNNIRPDAWHDPKDRRIQAEYLMTCAKAAIEENVVVFMPFVLAHERDPFAMTESATQTFPSWKEYQALTKRESLNAQMPLAKIPQNPSRVILQWIPDNTTCRPYKPGGIYWFKEDQPIRGTLWVYYFGDQAADFLIQQAGGPDLITTAEAAGERTWRIQVPAGGRTGVPLTLPQHEGANYRRDTYQFQAVEANASGPLSSTLALTKLEFRTGTAPSDSLPNRRLPIPFSSQAPGFYISSETGAPVITGAKDPWVGWNGVRFPDERNESETNPLSCLVKVDRPGPMHPPMLAASVNGLPGALERGFLKLTAIDAVGRPTMARVDLIDRNGQRFSVVENLGRPRDDLGDPDIFLAYADFHPWVFGTTVPGARFDPGEIREIQIRFYAGHGGSHLLNVQLEALEYLP